MSEPFKDRLTWVANEIFDADRQAGQLRKVRTELMINARKDGMKYAEIADYLRVTKAYVHQQVAKATKAEVNES